MNEFDKRWKQAERASFIKFALVGIINTGVSFALYVLLVKSGLYYILASILAYLAGIGVSYLLNTLFVFRQKRTLGNLSKFISVYVSALLLNLALLYLMVDVLGLSKIVGQLTVTGLVLFYNYFLQKIWTFGKR